MKIWVEDEVFVAMWNMPGYLPEMDPAEFDNYHDAKAFLIDELERTADDYAGVDDELYKTVINECEEAMDSLEKNEYGNDWMHPVPSLNLVYQLYNGE